MKSPTPTRQKKRKQHYVWQHYLRAWTTDGKLWCQLGERQFQASTESIAQGKDFYRLKEMSESDLMLVQRLISGMSSDAQEMAQGWIPLFTTFHTAKRKFKESGLSNDIG